MGRTATVHFVSSRTCLVNLPLSITGALSQRGVAPQSIAVQLSFKSSISSGGGGKREEQRVFVGWTGLPSSVPSIAQNARSGGISPQDRVEIDPQFAQMLNVGLGEGVQVTIDLLRELPHATTVNVTPASADDWEILETNAEFVEMFLLNQVRAVKEGMMIGCWVNGSTLVKFLVDSTEPQASAALLLTSSTELIVAPKSRHAPPPPSSSKTHDLSSTSSTTNATTSNDWITLRKKLLRLLPLESDPTFRKRQDTRDEDINVDSSDHEESIYLNPTLYRSLYRIFPGQKLSLSWVHRPKSKVGAGSGGGGGGGGGDSEVNNSGPTTNSSSTTAKGQEELPSSAGGGDSTNSTTTMVEVRIRESRTVGVGHVWVGEALRGQLGLLTSSKQGNFELLRIGPPLSASKRKAARSKESQARKDAASPPSPSTVGSPKLNGTMPSLHQKLASTSLANGTANATSKTNSTPTLAGVETQISTLSNHIINSLASRRFSTMTTTGTGSTSNGSSTSAAGILVTGASGAGKTALVREVSKRMESDQNALTHTIHVDCSKFSDERQPSLKNRIKDWFDEACWHAPTVLVLDNLDRILPAEVEHADSFASLHLANLFYGIAQSALESRPIIVVATAQGTTTIHPLLSSTHLLGETVNLKGPTKSGRKDILNSLIEMKTSTSNLSLDPKFNPAAIAAITEGYLPADLKDFVDRAVHQAAIRTIATASSTSLVLTADDFLQAQTGFVPLSLRDVKLQKSETQWADIGGLHETRKTLRETLEWPTKYGAIFASCPLRLRSGLLLYGFPGCGKTLLASAVAKECGLNFISVKGPEILNKYIGASEKSVRDLFDRASAAKPCVLFFDEFDSIAPKRGHDSTGVTDRVVNQMLTQMDGAEGLDGVYVLAATSRPDLIDPALLRPGRLDKSLLCDMPSYEDRLEIMTACSRKIHLSPSVSLPEFAKLTQGYSGADLQALMYNAHLDAIHAGLNALEGENAEGGGGGEGLMKNGEVGDVKYVEIGRGGKEGKGTEGGVRSKAEQAVVNKRLEQIVASMLESRKNSKQSRNRNQVKTERQPTIVEPHHLRKSLESTRPSVPPEELYRLRKIYNDFVSTRSKGGLPSGEASDQVGGRASLM